MAPTAFGFEDENKRCEKNSVLDCNTDNTTDSEETADALAEAKQKTQMIEERFQKFKKEHRTNKRLVRKVFKIAVGNAKEAIVTARSESVAKVRESRAMKRQELVRRRKMEALSKERSSTRCTSRNSYSYRPMSGTQSTCITPDISPSLLASGFQGNRNMEQNLQIDLQRLKAKKRKNSEKARVAASFRSKSCDTGQPNLRPVSGRRMSDQCKVNWLTLELRNLKLSEQVQNLSVAFRKKKSSDFQLYLELERETKNYKTVVKQARKAVLEQEKIEAKRRSEMEKERMKNEDLECLMCKQERETEEKRKRREYDKMLQKNFQDSVFNTSVSRAKIFSYFPLLVICKPGEKSKVSRTTHCPYKHRKIPCWSLQEFQN